MGLKKKETREDYMKKYGLGASVEQSPKKTETRADYIKKYGSPGETKNLLETDTMNRIGQGQKMQYESAVEKGKRNQTLFYDNPLIQQQIRQETGPSLYDLMDDREKERYFYEIGKNGESAGKAYLEQITPKLQKMGFDTATRQAYEQSKDNVLAGLANNLVSSMGMGAGYIDDALRILRGKEVNPYSIGHTMSEIENVSRQAIKETARENIADNAVTDFLVDTGLSMGQTVARMPFGNYGLAIAGLGAATKGAEDARERGATNTQALLAGGAQGAAEALAEKYSLGSLKAMKEVPVHTVKDVAKNVIKQMGAEASEEAVTELANTVSDRMIMGEKSNWNTMKEQYMEQGDTEGTAALKAIADIAKNIVIAGAGGALSGGLMGGGVSGFNAVQQNRLGKLSGDTNYQEFAEAIETDKEAYDREEDHGRAVQLQQMAQEFADRQIAGEELSNLERGRFEQDLYEFQHELNKNGKIAPVQEEKTEETKNNVIETHKNVQNNVNPVSAKEDINEFGAELGEYGKKALVDNYDGTVMMNDYRTAFNRYYDAGRHNVDLKTADRAAMASVISDEQSVAAYKAGVQDRNAAAGLLSADGRYVKGREKTGSALDLSGRATEAQMNFANQVGKKTGLRIELVDGTGDIGGVYNRKAGTIRISVDSDNFLQTTSHELTHFIKDYARIDFEVYSDICVNALMNSDKISYDDLVGRYEQKYMETGTVKTRDEIMEEIVADATGRFLNDEEFVKQIAKENRTVAQKIVDFISDMIDSIKQLISTKGTTKVSNALKEQLEFYEDAREIWAAGLENAGERYRSGEELADTAGERFMLEHPEEVTDDKIAENFKYVRNMDPVVTLKGDEFTRRDIKVTEQILEYYNSFGNVVHNEIVGDILLKKRSVKDDVAHGIGRLKSITFQAVPDVLEKGKVLQHEKQWKGRGYDTVTIGARVDIESGECAGEYYVACIVKVDETNRMYLHEVHTTKMDDTAPFWTGGGQKTVLPGGDNHPSISSIFEKLTNVNGEDERFQLKDPMEETKNLIAVHNLTADKLLKTFQLEGIPMPSIAITKADMGHETFGDISLLFRKDTIDPKKKKNKVYSADAWTPTFPRIEYEANKYVIYNAYDLVRNVEGLLPEEYRKEAKAVMNNLDSYLQADGSEEQVANRLKEKTAIKALYLVSQGEKIEEKTKTIRTEKDKNSMFEGFLELFEEDLDTIIKTPYKELYEKYAEKMRKVAIDHGRTEEQAEMILAKKSGMIGGFSKTIDRLVRYAEKPTLEEKQITDYDGMKRDIEERIDPEEYGAWVDELVKGLLKDSGIRNGKETFTASGKRRGFKDTHFEVTAKNIVKSMLTQGSDAKNIAGFMGIKTIRAATTDEFKSIKDIKAAESKLKNLTEEEFEEIAEKLTDRLYNVMKEILESSVKDTDYNRLMRLDNIGELIQAASDNPTADNIRKQFSGTAWQITDEQAKEIQSIVQDVRSMPVNMFEAKPQRVVEYDEIEAAVVPDDVSEEVLRALDQKGVRVITYNTKEPEARKRAVNSVEGIRFQLQGIDDGTDTDSLLAENAELRKANEYLTQQLNSTKDYAPGLQDIEKIASRIRKEYGSTYPQTRLVENLQKLYNYIRNADRVDGEEVTRAATAIGRSIIEKAEMKDTAMKEQYQDLLDHIKNTKIVLPERFRSELDTIGGYTKFRKQYFGKIKLGNTGVDVDTAYEELVSLYPGVFDETIVNPADQIRKIAEVVDMVRPTIKNPYHGNIDEVAYLAGQELFKEYFNVRSLEPTKLDKMDAQVYQLRQKYEEQLNAYKLRLKAEYEGDMNKAEKEFVRQRQALSDQYNNTPKEETAARAEIRKKLRELEANADVNKDVIAGKLKYQRRRDASEARKHKERIIKDVTEMAVWLEKPTDKKHVPEALRGPLADFLKDVDFSSNKTNAVGDPTSRTNAWRDLKDLFGKIVANGGMSDKEGDFYMEVDPDIAEKMDALKNKVQDFDKMENLDLKDLRTLREVIQSMKRCVIDANYMYQNKMYERIEEVADAFQKDNAERKDKIEYAGTLGKAMRMMQSDMLDAHTMFERMGPAATSVYQELRDGFDKKIRNTKVAQDYMADLLKKNGITEKDIREWSGKNAKVYEFDTSGGKVKFTRAQIMSLYAQNKREQARGHIYSDVGGIKTAPTVRYDKKKKGYVIDKQHAPVKVTPYDVIKITEELTPEQKNLVDGIVKFFTTQTSEWGNEVTLRMYGYKKFMAPNYFPIVTDKNYLATKNSEIENSITTLKNMGATKSTVYKANNPIIIEDIFDVFTRQADQMGSYNAFVIPLSDMQKFLNHKVKGEGSVKETVDRIFGPGGQDYIKQLMVDVNGASTGTKDLTSAMTRNMKAASVGANLRTVIQQPTAYARAMVEIDPKYLAKGLAASSKDWDMAKKYAPIVQWKEWGYFDINTGRSMKNILMGSESIREDLTEKSMWLTGKADEYAWKHLWEAVKAETRDLHPELAEGSEEFYTKAGNRLTEIIDRTQVVDSVIHRSKLMKSSNGLVQMYTSFMSEPTKTYNMLYRAIAEYGINKNEKSKKMLQRTLVTWAVSNAVTAMAAAVIDAMRDEDDEKTLPEKYAAAVSENMVDNFNPVNMVPLLRDVESIWSGYQVLRTDMQAMQQTKYAWDKIEKYVNGESDLTIPGLMYECSKALSLMTGVPVNNALRDLNAAVNTVLGETGNVSAIYSKERMFKDIESTGNLKRYVSLAMKAYYQGDKETGDRIIKDLKTAGTDESTIETKYKTALKDNSLVNAAAEARVSGNYGEYDALLDELEEQGLVREYVEVAVASVANKLDPDANFQTGYGYADVTRAYRTSKSEFDRVVDALMDQKKEEKKAEGKTFEESDVISQIKARFTKEYKDAYINGNDAKRKEIRTELYSVKLKGKQLFTDKDFKNWMK